MSYINEALKKAQKEKDTQKYHFQPIFARVHDKRFRIESRYIFAFLLVLIIASTAGTFYWMWQQEPSPDNRLVKPAKEIPKEVMKSEVGMSSPEQGKTESKPEALSSEKMAVEQDGGAKAVQSSGASLPAQSIAKERLEAKGSEATDQQNVKILYREALASQKRQDLSAAERLYKKLLSLDPKNVKAINNLGVIYMQQNQKDHAIQMFDRAISIKKDYVDPYYNMACLYAQFSDLTRSMKYLRAAANINPEIKKWAKSDRDLKNVQTSPEFLKFIGYVDGKGP